MTVEGMYMPTTQTVATLDSRTFASATKDLLQVERGTWLRKNGCLYGQRRVIAI